MKKIIIISLGVIVSIGLVLSVVFSCRYIESLDSISAQEEKIDELTLLSEEIDETYNNLSTAIGDVRFNCESGIKSLILKVEDGLCDFEKYANKLIELIQKYEDISGYDYSDVYSECDVEAVLEDTLEWQEEALENAIQWDEETNSSSAYSAMIDESSRAEEAVQEIIDNYNSVVYGIENYSLEKKEASSLFIGIDEILENEKAIGQLRILKTESSNIWSYMVICIISESVLIISMIIVLIIFRIKNKKKSNIETE